MPPKELLGAERIAIVVAPDDPREAANVDARRHCLLDGDPSTDA